MIFCKQGFNAWEFDVCVNLLFTLDKRQTYTAESAIEKIGFGKFQMKVLAMIGFAWVGELFFSLRLYIRPNKRRKN